jgi:hypothetical protein
VKGVLATGVLFAALAGVFFTQDPIEARHRPWRGPHLSEDGWYYYYYLRSAVLDGDLDLDNDYRDFGNWYGFGVTRTGRRHNPFGVGPALFWAPGFLVGHAIATIAAGPRDVVDGMTREEQGGALCISLLAAAGAFWIAFSVARRCVRVGVAWIGTAIAFLGGPIVWYAVYSPSMPHALEAFFGAAFVSALLPFRRRTYREAVLLGAIGGGMMLVRPQLAVFFAVPLCEAAVLWRRREVWQTLAPLVVTMAIALLVFLPQLLIWKLVYGNYVVVPQGSGFMRFAESRWVETLFSSRNGLFTTTPLLWFVLLGLYFALRRDRRLGAVLIVMLFIDAFVNGAVWDWWGGGAFGGRRFAATFPVWAIALSLILERVWSAPRFGRIAIALTMAVVAPLLWLQWRMIAAHHDHAFSWDATVPFDERVSVATGGLVPASAVVFDPFAFPANVAFALRHRVPIARYDRAVGPYLLDERVATTNPMLSSKRTETVHLADPSAIAFLGRGFEQTSAGAVLRSGVGELFVPLNRPGSFELSVAFSGSEEGTSSWAFNGHRLASPPFHIEATWVERGINVLRVEADNALAIRELGLAEGPDWPPAWAVEYGAARQ